ncbi:Lysophospholipase L1 [Minicystis rosea]|nr:Lysophospholipase L1 [Minicystis rosea]
MSLGLGAVILVLGTHLVWPRAAGSVATVTYAWLQRRGPERLNVSVDLYAPPHASKRAPLVVLLQGNDPSQPDERLAFAANVGDALQRKGVSTAAVSFNIRDGYTLRACATEVAGLLKEMTSERNPTRLILMGRGVGATMASILTLDRRLLEGAGMDPKRIDGVITLRGTYDLDEAALEKHPDAAFFARSVEDRRESSPITYVRPDAPPFLMLFGGDDEAGWPHLARPFARALRDAGARDVDNFTIPKRDAHNILHWNGKGNEVGELVFTFVASGIKELSIDNPFGVLRRWGAQPPVDLSAFRKDAEAITTYPVDAPLRDTLLNFFGEEKSTLYPYAGKTYQAINLLDYLAKRPASDVGEGDWLVVSNLRGEQQYFSREMLKKTQPVIVVGLDDEDNLNRLFTFYRMKLAYSWIKSDEQLPTMIRPIGAFMHFRTPLPAALRNKTYAPFGLDATSFHWVKDDPLAPLRSLTGGLREAVIGEQGCVTCHKVRGAGARAHHALALDAKPHGAFGLPLEEYPADVLHRFLFEQDAVAKSFGVKPLRVEKTVAQQIFDLVRYGKITLTSATEEAAPARGVEEIRYLALGDSFTAGTGNGPADAFPARLAALWRTPSRQVTLKNLAVNGYTTEDLQQAELPEVAAFRPTLVTLAVGANDYVRGWSADVYRAHVREILRAIIDAGVAPNRIVTLPQPEWSLSPSAASLGDPRKIGTAILAFNTILRDEARAVGARYVDLYPLMHKQAEARMLAPDGLHPSASAHAEWAAELYEQVEPMPNGRRTSKNK